MSPLYLLLFFFLSSSFAIRDADFKLCSRRKAACFEHSDRIDVSIPTLNQLPCLTVCTDRKLSPIPRSNPTVLTSLLLLLSGDINLNPGPISVRAPINHVRMATINVRSISNKTASFCDIVESKKLDVVAVTETWLSTNETSASLADVTPNGFKLVHKPRKGRGGGVAIMVNELFNSTPCDIPTYTSFEAVACKIATSSLWAHVICLYRLQDYPSEFWTNLKTSSLTCHPCQERYLLWEISICILIHHLVIQKLLQIYYQLLDL